MEIEFRHIAVVHEIARAGSIARAARRLGLSQPAASELVARLERYVGQPIFSRSRSGVRPTAFGRDLLAESDHLLPIFAELLDTLAARKCVSEDDIHEQSLRFGGIPSAATTAVMASLLTHQRSAGLRMRQDLDSAELLEMLGDGRLEMAVVAEHAVPDNPPGVSSQGLGADVWTVSVGPRHRLRDLPTVRLAELRDEQWLLSTGLAPSVKTELLRACSAAGFLPHIVAEVESSTLTQLIAEGHGVSVDVAGVPSGGANTIRLADGPTPVSYLLAWRTHAVTAREIDAAIEAGTHESLWRNDEQAAKLASS
ncbi:MAG TPA: LysR family transcriptional regulator [Pseudonocardiaceae bacterium]|jgi:molybdate transport repressor ModE-like protein|nr:LysR family transcriptional regulator [Pseudonocardiaceae bacterium]